MDCQHWEQLYQIGETRWEKGAPAPGLVDFLRTHRDLPRGRVLIPGCGTGHDVRAFAAAGFEATGLDFAPSAVALAHERTRAVGISARYLQQDFLCAPVTRRCDWLFEHTLFCAIRPGDRQAYVDAVLRWLRPGGEFLAIHYLLPCGGNEPPFGVTRQEIWSRFSPHFLLVREWIPRSHPNRAGLEWMVWWRRKDGGQNPRSVCGTLNAQGRTRPHPVLTIPQTEAPNEARAVSSRAPRVTC